MIGGYLGEINCVRTSLPVILRVDGFRFFFYSNEGNPRERAHVHVRRDGAEAKVWLVPEVSLARNDGFDARTLRNIVMTVTDHKTFMEEAWNEYFS